MERRTKSKSAEPPQTPASLRAESRNATRATTTGGFFIPGKFSQLARDIVLAELDDLPFLIHLQRRFSNALGFIPAAGLEWYLEHRRVHLAIENGEPAGYCLGRAALRWEPRIRPITQAAISFDLQRRHAGLALVRRAEDEARQQNREALQAMCRADLDANQFWIAAGFEEIGRYQPATSRQKEMICWRKLLVSYRPWYFDALPPVCGHRARRRPRAKEPTLFQ